VKGDVGPKGATGATGPKGRDAIIAASHGQNGYIKFYSGTIIQWTFWSQPHDADTTINFPIAFPNACRSIVVTRHNSQSQKPQHAKILSKSQWAIMRPDEIDGTSYGYMMCIGY
jgi:hypothetical protein